MELEDVARTYLLLEAGVFDAAEQRDLSFIRRHAEERDGTGLCEGLDDEDTWHHRILREVALEEGLVHRDALSCIGELSRLIIHHLVNQEKRIAVRDDLLDFIDTEWMRRMYRLDSCCGFACFRRSVHLRISGGNNGCGICRCGHNLSIGLGNRRVHVHLFCHAVSFQAFRKIRQALWPPKPREFEST